MDTANDESMTPTTMRTLAYNPALDGLRAFAVAGVVVAHMGMVLAGYHGVTLFFVISGYLITTLLIQEFDNNGRISLRSFYRRRFARLAPVLVLSVLVTVLWLVIIRLPVDQWWAGPLATLTYTMDIVQAVWGNWSVSFYFQFNWSLGLEEQFYLIWPLALILLLRYSTVVMQMVVLVCGILIDWVLKFWQDHSNPTHELQYFGPVSNADSILLGCLAAIVLINYGHRALVIDFSRLFGPFTLLGLYYLAIHPNGLPAITPVDAAGFDQAAVLSAILVMWMVTTPCGIIARILGSKPLAFLGRLSYSIYLWNILLMWVFTYFAGHQPWFASWKYRIAWVAILVVWSWVSYRFVESPLRRRWSGRRTGVEAAPESTGTQPRHLA